MKTHGNRKSINLITPLITGVVSGADALNVLDSTPATHACDILEFRIDALAAHLDEAEDAIKSSRLPTLITVRDPMEGGEGSLDAIERIELYERFLPLADAIDIEIRNLEQFSRIVQQAERSSVPLVASFHDFKRFPESTVSSLLQKPPSADVLKIAVHLDSRGQMDSLFALFAGRRPLHPAAVMGMGSLGPESRLRALEAGSILNYGYLVSPNAPGQSSVLELREALTKIQTDR